MPLPPIQAGACDAALADLRHALFIAKSLELLRTIDEIEAQREALLERIRAKSRGPIGEFAASLAELTCLISARQALDWALGREGCPPLEFNTSSAAPRLTDDDLRVDQPEEWLAGLPTPGEAGEAGDAEVGTSLSSASPATAERARA